MLFSEAPSCSVISGFAGGTDDRSTRINFHHTARTFADRVIKKALGLIKTTSRTRSMSRTFGRSLILMN
jgi:ATP-dependent protease HslVU (ClpYQ) peptidase subunit